MRGLNRETDTEALSPAVRAPGRVSCAEVGAEIGRGRSLEFEAGHVPGMAKELMRLRTRSMDREVYLENEQT